MGTRGCVLRTVTATPVLSTQSRWTTLQTGCSRLANRRCSPSKNSSTNPVKSPKTIVDDAFDFPGEFELVRKMVTAATIGC